MIEKIKLQNYKNFEDVEIICNPGRNINLEKFGVAYMIGFGYRATDIPNKKQQTIEEFIKIVQEND